MGPHGWAGQGYGELETGLSWALLGQEMMALRADMRSWAVDRMEETPRGTVRALEVLLGPQPTLNSNQDEQNSFFGTFPHGFSQ